MMIYVEVRRKIFLFSEYASEYNHTCARTSSAWPEPCAQLCSAVCVCVNGKHSLRACLRWFHFHLNFFSCALLYLNICHTSQLKDFLPMVLQSGVQVLVCMFLSTDLASSLAKSLHFLLWSFRFSEDKIYK